MKLIGYTKEELKAARAAVRRWRKAQKAIQKLYPGLIRAEAILAKDFAPTRRKIRKAISKLPKSVPYAVALKQVQSFK